MTPNILTLHIKSSYLINMEISFVSYLLKYKTLLISGRSKLLPRELYSLDREDPQIAPFADLKNRSLDQALKNFQKKAHDFCNLWVSLASTNFATASQKAQFTEVWGNPYINRATLFQEAGHTRDKDESKSTKMSHCFGAHSHSHLCF